MESTAEPEAKRPRLAESASEMMPNQPPLLGLKSDATGPESVSPTKLATNAEENNEETALDTKPGASDASVAFSGEKTSPVQEIPGNKTSENEPHPKPFEVVPSPANAILEPSKPAPASSVQSSLPVEQIAARPTGLPQTLAEDKEEPNKTPHASPLVPPEPSKKEVSGANTTNIVSSVEQVAADQHGPNFPPQKPFLGPAYASPERDAATRLAKPLQPNFPAQKRTETAAEVKPNAPVTRLVILAGECTAFSGFLDGLRHQTTDIVTEITLDKVSTLETKQFHTLHLCVAISDTCEDLLAKTEAVVASEASLVSKSAAIGIHFNFSEASTWAQVPTPIKTAYSRLLDALEKTAALKVVQCSFIEKYIDTPKEEAENSDSPSLKQLLEEDIRRWKHVQVVDFAYNHIRLVSGIAFPECLQALNLAGGGVLETLSGLKMPSQLKSLDVSGNAITSVDYVVFPQTLETLDFLNNRLYFLTHVDFPFHLKHLDLSHNRLDNLKGVIFPRNLRFLSLSHNPIECIKGVRFPDGLEYLDASCMPNESMTGIKFPDRVRSLNLQSSMTTTRGLKLPVYVENLNLACNGVNSINPLKLPNSIQTLYLANNNIKTLNKVVFPAAIRELYLGNNMITTLKNVHFPPTLEVLDFEMDPHNDENEKFLTSLKDVYFPAGLRVLNLAYHLIKNIEALELPYNLEELSLAYNDLRVFRNIKFGPKLRILDLSGNQDLLSLENVYFPESLRELKLPSVLLNSLPGSIVERANKNEVRLSKSLPYGN